MERKKKVKKNLKRDLKNNLTKEIKGVKEIIKSPQVKQLPPSKRKIFVKKLLVSFAKGAAATLGVAVTAGIAYKLVGKSFIKREVNDITSDVLNKNAHFAKQAGKDFTSGAKQAGKDFTAGAIEHGENHLKANKTYYSRVLSNELNKFMDRQTPILRQKIINISTTAAENFVETGIHVSQQQLEIFKRDHYQDLKRAFVNSINKEVNGILTRLQPRITSMAQTTAKTIVESGTQALEEARPEINKVAGSVIHQQTSTLKSLIIPIASLAAQSAAVTAIDAGSQRIVDKQNIIQQIIQQQTGFLNESVNSIIQIALDNGMAEVYNLRGEIQGIMNELSAEAAIYGLESGKDHVKTNSKEFSDVLKSLGQGAVQDAVSSLNPFTSKPAAKPASKPYQRERLRMSQEKDQGAIQPFGRRAPEENKPRILELNKSIQEVIDNLKHTQPGDIQRIEQYERLLNDFQAERKSLNSLNSFGKKIRSKNKIKAYYKMSKLKFGKDPEQQVQQKKPGFLRRNWKTAAAVGGIVAAVGADYYLNKHNERYRTNRAKAFKKVGNTFTFKKQTQKAQKAEEQKEIKLPETARDRLFKSSDELLRRREEEALKSGNEDEALYFRSQRVDKEEQYLINKKYETEAQLAKIKEEEEKEREEAKKRTVIGRIGTVFNKVDTTSQKAHSIYNRLDSNPIGQKVIDKVKEAANKELPKLLEKMEDNQEQLTENQEQLDSLNQELTHFQNPEDQQKVIEKIEEKQYEVVKLKQNKQEQDTLLNKLAQLMEQFDKLNQKYENAKSKKAKTVLEKKLKSLESKIEKLQYQINGNGNGFGTKRSKRSKRPKSLKKLKSDLKALRNL